MCIRDSIRGFLTEFCIVVELGATKIRRKLAELESDTAYPQSIQLMAQSVREQVGVLDKRLAECERQIAQQSKSDPAVIRLRSRPGIGPLTADAIIATVGDARQFKNGRQFAASLGITPRQHGSGGKTHLGAITRRGDSYLRSLLVQGARCVLQAALRLHKNKPDTPVSYTHLDVYKRQVYDSLNAEQKEKARLFFLGKLERMEHGGPRGPGRG